MKALSARGWVISPGEQDAHELFHVLVDTLEEELVKNKPLPRVRDYLTDIISNFNLK